MGFFSRKTVAIPEIHVVERVVVGEPTVVDVYHAYVPGDAERYGVTCIPVVGVYRPREELGYFLSCYEAFTAHAAPDLKVEKHKAIIVDGHYFLFSPADHIKVNKPKKAKGKS